MITAKKCDCCIHDPVCKLKMAYQNACESIKRTTYESGGGVAIVKDSNILSVAIECVHMLPATQTREV